MFQPSSALQVLDLLNSSNVEPVIRRSALTQLSVITEDAMVHSIFLSNDGIETLVRCMKSSLNEKDYQDYPDSIVPCITVLKNICLYNPTVCQELGNRFQILCYVLRGIFMFSAEERPRHDGAILLFLLLYGNYIVGTPNKSNLSIPKLMADRLLVPFKSHEHWSSSVNVLASIKGL